MTDNYQDPCEYLPPRNETMTDDNNAQQLTISSLLAFIDWRKNIRKTLGSNIKKKG